LATLLTGRYIAINIQPYSFKEYAVANKDEKNTDRLFRKYINDSCFLEAVTFSQISEDLVKDYLQTIYDTVFIKDIAKRYKRRNIYNLHQIIGFLFDSVGSYVSPTNIAVELNKNSQKKYHTTPLLSIWIILLNLIFYMQPHVTT
jgi:uncharacterized protein